MILMSELAVIRAAIDSVKQMKSHGNKFRTKHELTLKQEVEKLESDYAELKKNAEKLEACCHYD